MVFTTPIMTTHVNKTKDQPLMNLIDVGMYISTYVEILKRSYWEPFVITQGIPNHKNGHSIRPNKAVLKYLDFKKYVDPDAHVKVFNFVVKANV
jgi:hypothetical protein